LISEQVNVVFACSAEDREAVAWLKGLGWQTEELSSSLSSVSSAAGLKTLVGKGVRADWLVVDSYQIDSRWLAAARPMVGRLAVIDDLADRYLDCELLINQNPGYEDRYKDLVPPGARLLIGPRFALLRRPFIEARDRGPRRCDGRVARILIFFGGADVDNTAKAVQALALLGLGDVSIDIVVGPGSQSVDALEELVGRNGQRATIYRGVTAEQMAFLMEAADLSVGAAGSASWERCCLGLPAVMLAVADNQKQAAEELDRQGSSLYAGDARQVDVERLAAVVADLIRDERRLRKMSERGLALIDGLGSERVRRELLRT